MTNTDHGKNADHPDHAKNDPSRADASGALRIANGLARRTNQLLIIVLIATAAFAVPFLAMAPVTSASTEPSGDVFTARDRIDESFVSSVHPTFLILEHESGDVLTAEALSSLLAAEEKLRSDPRFGPTLLTYVDRDSTVEVNGVISLADLVDAELRAESIDGLNAATDLDVKRAGSAVIDRLGERSELIGISAQSTRTASGWTVPAVSAVVVSDNEALGFGNLSINLGGGTEVEEFDRAVQEVFRVDGWQANGVAIDVNLTSQEQGVVAGPFIGFTILAVLLLVGLAFRSYWVLATVSVAFLMLIIWLKGISNLIGLKDDLVLSLIVPVAMISFGVDFAFHAVGRYREERVEGRSATTAIVTGTAAVSGALLLALVSDTTAFLANLTSGIESINQFGIGASIALVSAYFLLGIVTPLVVARIESAVPVPTVGRRSLLIRIAGSLGAAGLAMAAVLMLVYVSPPIGLALTATAIVLTMVVPFLVRRRQPGARVGDVPLSPEGEPAGASPGRFSSRVGHVVRQLAERRSIVLPAAVLLTAAAAVVAVRVPAEFDVEDFFSGDTDFVIGLDQLDTHVGDRGGEPAIVYIEGDLTDPANLAAIAGRMEQIRDLDASSLARDESGRVQVFTGMFDVFDRALSNDLMLSRIEGQTGVAVTDVDADGIPDTRDQVEALLTVASESGVPLDEERVLVTPDQVNTVVKLYPDTEDGDRAVLQLGVVDSRAQESVTASKDALEPIAEAMADDLGGTFVQVTGSAFVREASLDGTNRALQLSLPLSVVLCLIIAATFLRSLRYGVAAITPILMVVAWLYAFMYLTGYAINLVTATIAAVSIGIGIDFAIHYIVRYREELAARGHRLAAVEAAGAGTGMALVASALSSAVGFGVLALAPMPLFAAYGLLTAIMIAMALVATLTVLPGVLVFVTTDPVDDPAAAIEPTVGGDHRPVTAHVSRSGTAV